MPGLRAFLIRRSVASAPWRRCVLSELQSIQTRVTAQRKKLDSDNPWAQVPAVCADVVRYLMQGPSRLGI